MRVLRRRTRPCCIFCIFTRSATFSTTSLKQRQYLGSTPANVEETTPRFRRKINFETFHEKNLDTAALFSDRWDRPRHSDGDRRALGVERSQRDVYSWRPDIDGIREQRAPFGRPRGRRHKVAEDFQTFEEAFEQALEELKSKYQYDTIFKRLPISVEKLEELFEEWCSKLLHCIETRTPSNPAFKRLKGLWPQCSNNGFKLYTKYAFYDYCMPVKFGRSDREDQVELANLRYPTEWFPATRGFQREFHLHVGPTNSGKTYHALKRLEQANTGLYAGPLRLLAHEVYMRLNANGARCNLITGDERRSADNDPLAPMTSCTVEMVPLNAKLDVAVIDEIQMIGAEDRGWAWTQAVLGIMAKEVHCCGEERVVPIMQELVAMCGEKLHIHRYQRLSPLVMADESLDGDLRRLRKGDCVVAFKIVDIHALRQVIEKTLKLKVAVIYGSLPPETRAQQARLFNDPDSGYDILVASNAIGMGLNLSIKRLIFQTSRKFDGTRLNILPVAETKQIAGRAGRYSTARDDIKNITESNLDIAVGVPAQIDGAMNAQPRAKSSIGYVTTLESIDFPIIQKLMSTDAELIKSAGIQPPAYVIERFAKYFPPGTPFAYLLIQLNELAETSARFFICDLRQALSIADIIEEIEGLTTTDRLIFCAAPIEARRIGEPELARAYARLVAENRAASIVDIEELDLDLLDEDYKPDRTYLTQLEGLHKGVIVWNWLSFRFAGVFINRELAEHVKGLVEARIEEVLQKLAFDYTKMRKKREQVLMELLSQEQDAEKSEEMEEKAEDQVHSARPSSEKSGFKNSSPETHGVNLDELETMDKGTKSTDSAADAVTPNASEPSSADLDETLVDDLDAFIDAQDATATSPLHNPESSGTVANVAPLSRTSPLTRETSVEQSGPDGSSANLVRYIRKAKRGRLLDSRVETAVPQSAGV